MYAFTELNLWDNSYWSFDKLTNFGMKIYQHRQDLFQIFKNLKLLFIKNIPVQNTNNTPNDIVLLLINKVNILI